MLWSRGSKGDSPRARKENVVIERRPVGLVTVSVAGMASGIGCTHTALMLATFLAKRGHSVALVEDSQRPVFSSITGLATGKCKSELGFRLYGVDIFPLPVRGDTDGYLYDQLMSLLSGYEYVVRDMGVLDSERRRELYRAGCGVVVASISSWRVMDLVRQHNSLNEDFGKIAVVSAFGTDKDRKMFKEVTGVTTLPLAWCPNPATLPDGGEEEMKDILGSLLPERKEIPDGGVAARPISEPLSPEREVRLEPNISEIYTSREESAVNYADLLGDDVFYAELGAKGSGGVYKMLRGIFLVVAVVSAVLLSAYLLW